MKAMILAAGFGTRLRPLTDLRPKPLVPVANKPVIEHIIDYLKDSGVTRIVVNVHHHAKQLSEHIENGRYSGVTFQVRHEPDILGTGGGLMNVADFWGDDTLLVVNGDILTTIDLMAAIETHKQSDALATLVLHDHPSFSQILLDGAGCVADISFEAVPGRLAFTGIHIVEPGLRNWIPQRGFADIIASYRKMLSQEVPIAAHVAYNHYWRDIGTLESYLEANRELSGESVIMGPGCVCHDSVSFNEWGIIGEGCRLDKDVVVERSVLWEGVRVKEGVRIIDSIVVSGQEVSRDLTGETYL